MSTVPETLALKGPAQRSEALAPGSEKVRLQTTVSLAAPLSVIKGAVVSTTLTVRVAIAVLPLASEAV